MIDYLADLSFVFMAVSLAFIPVALLCGIMEKVMDKYNLWDKMEKFLEETEE